MKVLICLAILALVAVVHSGPTDTASGKREGRYLLVADKGLYDNRYKSYVVVGTPVYAEYARSYYISKPVESVRSVYRYPYSPSYYYL